MTLIAKMALSDSLLTFVIPLAFLDYPFFLLFSHCDLKVPSSQAKSEENFANYF